MLSTIGALLPRDFLERQPKRWQKSQRKRRVLGTLKKMKAKREKVEQNAIEKAAREAGAAPQKQPTPVKPGPDTAPQSAAALPTLPPPSHCTPFGHEPRGIWAAELMPYQPLIVRIPEGARLQLLRASLTPSSDDGDEDSRSALRCRTPAIKLPATLCLLQREREETCSLDVLFTDLDRSCALAVEGADVVHVIGCYTRRAGSLPEDKDSEERETLQPQPPPPKPRPAAPTAPTTAAPSGQKPHVAKEQAQQQQLTEHDGGLKTVDTSEGRGRRAARGNKLTVKYTGVAPDKSGGWREFDSNNGKPFHFTLGEGEVIRGWDIGLVGMRRGGTRRLVVPPALAYGERGAGPVPPRATLIFEISLLNVV